MEKLRNCCIIILIFFQSNVLSGQGEIFAGAKGGLNFSNIVGVDLSNDPLPGFTAGGFFKYDITDILSIQPEVLFSGKGCNYDFIDIEEENDIRHYKRYIGFWKNNYVEIPVLILLGIPVRGRFDPNIFFAPAFAFNLSGKYDEDYEFRDYANNILINEESGHDKGDIDYIKNTDFGAIFGAGFSFRNLVFDARYYMGLINMSTQENFEGRNCVVSVMIGYSFPLNQHPTM